MKLFILLALVHVGLLASLRDLGAGADVSDGSGIVLVTTILSGINFDRNNIFWEIGRSAAIHGLQVMVIREVAITPRKYIQSKIGQCF